MHVLELESIELRRSHKKKQSIIYTDTHGGGDGT